LTITTFEREYGLTIQIFEREYGLPITTLLDSVALLLLFVSVDVFALFESTSILLPLPLHVTGDDKNDATNGMLLDSGAGVEINVGGLGVS
jgi:hypothetical protein